MKRYRIDDSLPKPKWWLGEDKLKKLIIPKAKERIWQMRGIAGRDMINYTTLNPGDGGILDKLQNVCGSHFQFLNSREKMALIRSLSIQLCMEFSELEYNLELNDLIRLANGLSIADRIGLIRCLSDNVSLPTMEKKNGN